MELNHILFPAQPTQMKPQDFKGDLMFIPRYYTIKSKDKKKVGQVAQLWFQVSFFIRFKPHFPAHINLTIYIFPRKLPRKQLIKRRVAGRRQRSGVRDLRLGRIQTSQPQQPQTILAKTAPIKSMTATFSKLFRTRCSLMLLRARILHKSSRISQCTDLIWLLNKNIIILPPSELIIR